MVEKKLGRGLGDLISGLGKAVGPVPPADKPVPPPTEQPGPKPAIVPPSVQTSSKDVREIKLECIIPNRFQPRKTIEPESFKELMESIKTAGVLQPIVVRPVAGKSDAYEIIMGERRFRACQALKKETIPAVLKEANDREMLEWALIENTHRKDLNPIERAMAYKELADTFQLTQDEVAKRVGADRTTVTNFIRLLGLPAEVQEDVRRQTFSVGHAMAILAVPDTANRLKLWRQAKNEDLSVRHLRIRIDAFLRPRGVATGPVPQPDMLKHFTARTDPNLKDLEDRFRRKFGTQVTIFYDKFQDKIRNGQIIIDFYSQDDFQRILEMIEK
ncbi:MAG: ParB/RepB/Spo0J family partition protein [Planctomycetes bacterium]|nr:ParB/RepB/Spo0J family partition protein [Planctomycetota bacterium]